MVKIDVKITGKVTDGKHRMFLAELDVLTAKYGLSIIEMYD